MAKKLLIKIDPAICGGGAKIDPRSCAKCLRVCAPAVFLLHQTFDVDNDRYDPQLWSIKPMWPTLCTLCMKCVDVCPEKAITIK
jgi:formate hydrogenlyase subunit 6/NADH:ubiquinone oxidoreductase subunit I